ncbi:MAG: hypothetical protein MJE77_45100 [Proteobacteria bacterium]|nr:hypothetical protein [Pseudomonadota bacterium]
MFGARLVLACWRRRRGRILAVKWGLNPNSSSLGVDVTFLLFGAASLALATPVVSALLRWRRPVAAPADSDPGDLVAASSPDNSPLSESKRGVALADEASPVDKATAPGSD